MPRCRPLGARSHDRCGRAIVLVALGVSFAVERGGTTDDAVSVGAGLRNSTGSVATARDGSVSTDSLNGLFVATSAEYNGPIAADSWMSFATRAYFAAFGGCLGKEGSRFVPDMRRSGSTPGVPRNNTQFPDLEKLRAGTFADLGSAETSVGAAPSTTVAAPTRPTAGANCDQAVVESYRQVAADVDTWVNRWGESIKGIDTDPEVASARLAHSSCMSDKGIKVTVDDSRGVVPGDVFSLADEATRNGDTARVTELAKAYGTCFAPVSDAMDAYRLEKRAEFYRQYQPELEQLALDIDHAETQISTEYGIPRP